MRKPQTVDALTELGRVRLSKTFFMRDMLYSEIAQIHGLLNAPDDPDLAIAAGTRLCEELLEPLQEQFGRIAIRSAYRSREVNALGNERGYNCASNEKNAAKHIWDMLDTDGCMGATACVVLPSAYDAHPEEGGWQHLALWIHDNLPYSSLYFFPVLWAVNINWHERPKRIVDSNAKPARRWDPEKFRKTSVCRRAGGDPRMAGRDWSEVVEEAVRRHVDSTRDPVFTRQELQDSEMNRIISETGSEGATPHQTLSRELQQLRDAGVLEFVDDHGTYRLIT